MRKTLPYHLCGSVDLWAHSIDPILKSIEDNFMSLYLCVPQIFVVYKAFNPLTVH